MLLAAFGSRDQTKQTKLLYILQHVWSSGVIKNPKSPRADAYVFKDTTSHLRHQLRQDKPSVRNRASLRVQGDTPARERECPLGGKKKGHKTKRSTQAIQGKYVVNLYIFSEASAISPKYLRIAIQHKNFRAASTQQCRKQQRAGGGSLWLRRESVEHPIGECWLLLLFPGVCIQSFFETQKQKAYILGPS